MAEARALWREQQPTLDVKRLVFIDETWAKEHHEYWYHEAIAEQKTGGGATSPAAASAMKEGWKQ